MVPQSLLRSRRPVGPVVALIVTVLGLSACNRVPLVAPSGSTITLVSSTNVLPVNGTTDLTAFLVQGAGSATGVGVPVHNGTVVTFTTSLGRIEPSQAETDGGKATVKLVGDGRSGTATITAISGAATKTLTVAIGAAGATRILVTANPQALPATGGSAQITAHVQDQQGNGLQGVPVSFTTTTGTLSSTSALTDEHGFAHTFVTTIAAATVTASSGGGTGTLSGTVALTLKPRTTITITPPGSSTVSVPSLFKFDVAGNTVVTSLVVNWGDGTESALGAVTSSASIQHLFASSGIRTVVATATDADGERVSQSTQVAVAPLVATGTAAPTEVTFGAAVVLTVTPTAGAFIDRYEWDFGDGTPVSSTQSAARTYVFQSRGTKVVRVRVFPTAGAAFDVLIQLEVK